MRSDTYSPRLRSFGWLLGLIFALAASPPLMLGDTRFIIPLLILSCIAIFLGIGMLLSGRGLARSVVAVWILLVGGLFLSIFGSVLSGTSVELQKLVVPLFQYSLLIVGYFLARRVNLGWMAVVVLIYAAGYSILLVLQALGYLPGANYVTREVLGITFNRAQLFFNQPNGVAAYIITAIPFTFLLAPRTRSRSLWLWILRLVLLLGLLVTFSRSAFVSLGLAFAIVYLLQRSGRYLLAPAVLFILLLATLTLVRPTFDLAATAAVSALNLQEEFSANERVQLMQAGLGMFYDSPWFGVGVGNFPERLLEYNPTLNPSIGIPHNTLIQFAAEQGSVGVIAYIALLVLALAATVRRGRVVFVVAWVFWAVTINGWFGWSFIHGLGELYMLSLGILLACARPPSIESHGSASHTQQGSSPGSKV